MKNKIIKKLNEYLKNNSELNELCVSLSNDPEKVLQIINKIIKYAFVTKTFITDTDTLVNISKKLNEVDSKYQQYLIKKKFSFFTTKEQFPDDFITLLDPDIRLSDLKGLSLPTKAKIEEICNKNKLAEEKRNNPRLKEERKFKLEAFTYSRKELITITPTFLYDYPEATGDIDKDFNNKYQESRYIDRPTSQHPLNKDYQTNINEIQTHVDILLKKVGDVYEINNGKHRILYIMKHKIPVEIPVIMTRRIEDQEFNEILYVLKEKYNARIYKNNILDDEPNILINIDGTAYIINNKNELLSFYRDLKNNEIENYLSIPFNTESNDSIETYENMIYQKYLEIGSIVLTSNFTDLSKYFDNINNLFYQAHNNLKKIYQESVVYKTSFNEYYEKQTSMEQNSKFDPEEWTRIMGKPRTKR